MIESKPELLPSKSGFAKDLWHMIFQQFRLWRDE